MSKTRGWIVRTTYSRLRPLELQYFLFHIHQIMRITFHLLIPGIDQCRFFPEQICSPTLQDQIIVHGFGLSSSHACFIFNDTLVCVQIMDNGWGVNLGGIAVLIVMHLHVIFLKEKEHYLPLLLATNVLLINIKFLFCFIRSSIFHSSV